MFKGYFIHCPKTDRIIGFNYKALQLKVLFPLVGVAALIWYIVRVAPKPSRAAYPCQKIALSLAGSSVIYFLSILGITQIFKMLGKRLKHQHKYIFSSVAFVAFLSVAFFPADDFEPVLTVSEGVNNPMGVGKGIFPGCVVWVQDFNATSWDGENGHWWDDANTDQAVADKMMADAILNLTGTTKINKA